VPRYVALLRGINVGGHTVKMDRLKSLFEEMGLRKVETFIASGNVVFESASRNTATLERKIGRTLEESLGFPAATFIRTLEQLAGLLEHETLRDLEARAVYIGFLTASPSKESRAKLLAHRSRLDEFVLTEREVYWLCRTPRMSGSPFFKIGIEKALGMKATVRNATTVAKLVEKFS
jgi:uncharacterized protein (DUF1697 family)